MEGYRIRLGEDGLVEILKENETIFSVKTSIKKISIENEIELKGVGKYTMAFTHKSFEDILKSTEFQDDPGFFILEYQKAIEGRAEEFRKEPIEIVRDFERYLVYIGEKFFEKARIGRKVFEDIYMYIRIVVDKKNKRIVGMDIQYSL